jgi:UDP-N-acetylglucosamine 1-carboxyvinyltransferase
VALHERLRVQGVARLEGEVRVAGAKNSALKLMAAALLAEGTTVLHSVPRILDVSYMAQLLRRLGCEVTVEGESVTIAVPAEIGHVAPYELVRRLRASISVLGPLVARCHAADVALPGGDAIGSRGLDMHLAGLEKLGATAEVEHGYVLARVPHGLVGAGIQLDFPSVGATENLVMAATLARGTTVIDNVAREPEIVDLCEMLNAMGARIAGVGSSMLEVTGVARLHGVEHTVVPDRIVSGTWAAAAAMTRGDVFVRNGRADHIEIVLDKLAWSGARLVAEPDGFRVVMARRPRSFDVVTLPFPGFATDLQPLAVAINAVADGTGMVTENVFESRFMFVNELVRLGANIRTDGHHAVIRGRERLSGAPVVATDIRAGAGLVMAGLVAEGETTVSQAYHIDRGYPDLVGNLRALGATITREDDPEAADGMLVG